MIIGPDGKTITKSGNGYFTNGGYVSKSGSTYYGPNGQTASETVNSIYSSQGVISITGNSLYTPNGVYSLNGSTLYGPNGQVWSGVESMEDAKVVVLNDLATSKEDNNQNLIHIEHNEHGEVSNGFVIGLVATVIVIAAMLIILLT